MRPIEGMDVARSTLLINDGIASGVARWRAIEKTVNAERKKKCELGLRKCWLGVLATGSSKCDTDQSMDVTHHIFTI